MGRSHRMRLWTRWALRDARRRWMLIVSIALLLALGVGMYASMSSMSAWRRDSADASFSALRMHDLRITLADGSFAHAGALRGALARIPSRRAVAAAEERLVVPTQVDASTRDRSILVPGRIVGAPIDAAVDRLAIARGRALRAGDDGQPVGVLERNFAKHYALPAAGTLRTAGGRTLRYTGHAEAPEYFIVTAPGADFGAEASFAVVFVGLKTAQRLSGLPARVNQLVLRLRPGHDAGIVQAEARRALQAALPHTGFTFTRAADEPARRLLYKDAEGDQKMMDVFAFLLLGAAAFAVFNLVSRTVEAQRREIGIGMALGVTPRALASRPFLLGGQIAVLGIALGIPVGLAANAWLRSVLETFFPLPVLHTPLEPAIFLRGAALGLAMPLLATALPVRRALRVTPVEAIRVGARAAGSSGLAWLAKDVRLPGGSLANLPLRNVLRTPRRTTMTVLGIGAVVTIIISLSGLMDSFAGTLAQSREEALGGARNRLTIDLMAPRPSDDPLIGRIGGAASVGAAEAALRLPSTLQSRDRRLDAFVEVVDPGGRLWRPTLQEGVLAPASAGLVIARRAAEDLGVGVGDHVAVRHPVPAGRDTFQLVTHRLPVTGIHTSPFRFVAYASDAAAATLQVEGLVNRLSVLPAAGRDADDVKRELLGVPGVTAVQSATAATDAVDQRMAQFTDVLVVAVAIGVAMALLIAFNASAINAEERAREHATMLASGLEPARVLRGNVAEGLLIGVLGTALGMAGGYGVLRWIVTGVMPETMPDVGTLISLRPSSFATAVLAGTVVVALAPVLTLRRLRRIDIPATLRVVE